MEIRALRSERDEEGCVRCARKSQGPDYLSPGGRQHDRASPSLHSCLVGITALKNVRPSRWNEPVSEPPLPTPDPSPTHGGERHEVDALTIEVRGVRPATFATAGERPWRAAVGRSAEQTGRMLRPGARLNLEVAFDLPPARSTTHGWDLDNLLKPTIDALVSVLGERAGSWRHPQPDDERIDRIVASKHLVGTLDAVGATISLSIMGGASTAEASQPALSVDRPRPILRGHTHDGRVVGDPLPLALGVEVGEEVVTVIERALEAFLLPNEAILLIARATDSSWEMYYVLTSHHFCRVALASQRSEARVVACAFEHAASGAVDIRFRSGDEVNLGPLTHVRDGHLLSSAMWNVRLPEGSDARRTFAGSPQSRV